MTSKVYGCICIKSVKGVWIRGGAFLDWKWHPSFLLMFYWQDCDSPFKIKGRGLGSLVSEGQHFWAITVYCGRETTHIWQRQSRNICRCCCSVAKMCPTLCDPMDCSIPGFLSFTRVCSNSCPLSWWCHTTISSCVTLFSSCPQSFPASGSFPNSWLLHHVARVLELQLQHSSFQLMLRADFL